MTPEGIVKRGMRGADGTVARTTAHAAIAARGIHPGVAASVALLLAAVLAIHWPTAQAMMSVWSRSETFTHGFVVIPIFLFLVWRQRDALALIEPRPCYPALAGVAAAAVLWLIGELVSADSVAQFAMVAMFPFAVWAVLGTEVVRVLGIPLAFLFFAVPFGDFLVPTMMDWTANFAIAAIRASGVPVFREGNFFTIPNGRWSVVEACSGIRYLIASLMVGSLYAYLSYRSTTRRIAFVAATIVVPIVANWLRAYMIVMLGYLTNNRVAVGVDHLVYGWIFFGIVMALLFWIGSRWRQDNEVDPVPAIVVKRTTTAGPGARLWPALVATLVLVVIGRPVEAWLGNEGGGRVVHLQQLAGSAGWSAVRGDITPWRPDISFARSELRQTFAKDSARVGIHIAFFRDQTRDTKAITTGNQLVLTSNLRWKRIDDATAAIAGGEGGPLRARSSIVTDDRDRMAVLQWFWVDGRVTDSEFTAKFYQVLSVIRGHGDPVAWVVVYTPVINGDGVARATLQAFAAEMRGSIDAVLRQAATR